MLSYLANIESENVLHVGRQFDEQHVPTEIVTGMRHQDGPERSGFQKGFPRYRQVLQIPS